MTAPSILSRVFAGQLVGSSSAAMESTQVWMALFVLVGALLRLYGLGFQSLWYDEGLQHYVLTNYSFGQLFSQTKSFHPPLSFLINYVFFMIDDSDVFLRLPSALFGIASLPCFYVLARELTSKRSAVFGLLVLVISPFHLWISQDGRMYSQLLFFSLLSSTLFIQALKRKEKRWWLYYTLASVAGMYTHVFMVLGLAAHALWLLLCHRRDLLSFSASGAAVALLFLPWAILFPWIRGFFRGLRAVSISSASPLVGRADFSWAAAPYTFFVYSAGFSLGPSIAELHANRSMEFIMSFLFSVSVVGSVFAMLLATGIAVMYKRFGAKPLAFALLSSIIPLVGVAAYSFAPRASFNVRYTLVAFPYFCLLTGTALAWLARTHRLLGTVAVLAVLVASATSLYNYFTNSRYAKEDVRAAVTFWRYAGKNEPLLSYKAKYTTDRYLDPSERQRHFMIGGKTVESIDRVLSYLTPSSAYILIARDWNGAIEKVVRNAFPVAQERAFPGVKILRISGCRAGELSDPLRGCGTRERPSSLISHSPGVKFFR